MMSSKTGKQLKFAVFSFLVAGLAVMLALVPAFFVHKHQAAAVSSSDWEALRTVINDYIWSQYNPADDGESGFLITAPSLRARLDSNGDGVLLGAGDDVSQVPVILDVLPQAAGSSNFVPGTNASFGYGSAASSIGLISGIVDAHNSGGFSTDIVSYCATGHTESPVVMFLGAYAQAGGFNGVTPRSYGLKWGKGGWATVNNNYYTGNYPVGPPALSPGPYGPPAPAGCDGLSLPALVACRANVTLSTVGSGTNPGANGIYQPVDLRPGFITTTMGFYSVDMALWSPAFQDPLLDLFNGGLSLLPTTTSPKLVFANRTQHSAGIAAEGAAMLGYSSSYLRWGLPAWNGSLAPEMCTGCGAGYTTVPRDTTAPEIQNLYVSDIGSDSAVISRITSEPATMKIEYGTSPGSYTNTINDTVLGLDKSLVLTGLNPCTVYHFRVTVYDGSANSSSTSEPALTTAGIDDRPDLVASVNGAGWATYGDYLARTLTLDLGVTNRGASPAHSVTIVDSIPSPPVTIDFTVPYPRPLMPDELPGGSSGSAALKYHVPPGVQSFRISFHATAESGCGTVYSYP